MDKLTIGDYLRNPDLLIPTPIFRIYHRIRHPVIYFRDWMKWRDRPAIGDYVEDCRYKVLQVVAFGDTEDDLVLEDGSHASWMNCCDRPQSGHTGSCSLPLDS